MIKEALRFTLTSSEPRDDEKASDNEDEDELEAIRRRRLEHLQNRNNARITEITDKEEFLRVIEATNNGPRAIIHIYRDDIEATETLNEGYLSLTA